MSDFLLRFVHISDTHINSDTDYIKDYAPYTPLVGAEALVKAVNALPFTPDFILHTGDVAFDPVPEVYPFVADTLNKLNAPVHYLVGNHDDNALLQTAIMGRAEADVIANLHYEFEHNGVQIVCVDSNDAAAEVPSGLFPSAQLEWLDTICAADDDRPLVIATHHNVIPVGVPWLDNWMRAKNGDEFHAIVRQARDRLRGVFHGHIHQNIDAYQDGVLYSAAASSWCQFMSYPMIENDRVSSDFATPPGFSVVTITENRTYIRRHMFTVE